MQLILIHSKHLFVCHVVLLLRLCRSSFNLGRASRANATAKFHGYVFNGREPFRYLFLIIFSKCYRHIFPCESNCIVYQAANKPSATSSVFARLRKRSQITIRKASLTRSPFHTKHCLATLSLLYHASCSDNSPYPVVIAHDIECLSTRETKVSKWTSLATLALITHSRFFTDLCSCRCPASFCLFGLSFELNSRIGLLTERLPLLSGQSIHKISTQRHLPWKRLPCRQ